MAKDGEQVGAPTMVRKTHRTWVSAALVLSTFTAAIEITIVATAMPRIVADLGGFALLSWVFSAYLLTQMASIPIYGKLADLYGRKPVLLGGLTLFLIASCLCGLATSMTQLIVFRFIQGLGGGAMQPMATTIAGDLYTPAERHRIQAWFGSVYAASAVAGPTLGAFIVSVGHWAWIFYLNVPLVLVAFVVLWFGLHEGKHTGKPQIDYRGAFLLTGATASLLFGLLQGGSGWPWLSWPSLSLALSSGMLTLGLVYWEARALDPILPLWVFRHRLIGVAGGAAFLNGATMMAYTAMIPTYVQGVLDGSPLMAGAAVAGMSVGWPVASLLAGRIMKRIGYRNTAIMGALAVLVGSLAVIAVADVSAGALCLALFVVGIGLGFQSNSYIITIQAAVVWRQRGVVTANNLFMRTLGSVVGVAACGGILNAILAEEFQKSGLPRLGGAHGLDAVNTLLDPTPQEVLGQAERLMVKLSLDLGMDLVFAAVAALAVVGLLLAYMLPHDGGEAKPT